MPDDKQNQRLVPEGLFWKASSGMSEFKFACPVCGQHLSADSGSTGLQIECPTCFQPILVPRPPAPGSKYILSATQPIKPHLPSAPAPAPPAPARKRGILATAAYAVALAIVVAGGFLGFKTLRSHLRSQEPSARPSGWTMDLHGKLFPNRMASGAINGRPFVCERAVLQGGLLTLREGQIGIPGLAVTIALFARQPEELGGRSFRIATNDTGAPHVVLRWTNDQGHQMTRTFAGGYAMKLQFGKPTPTGMPAKIYLCLPDEEHSFVAGPFNAELRRVSAPRPRSPDRNS